MALRRGRYDVEALHQRGGGRYWYTRGVNPVAMAWFVGGFLVPLVGYYLTARARTRRDGGGAVGSPVPAPRTAAAPATEGTATA
jgi:cytosine/uracil/thiamine/allantoin permease